MAVLCINLSAVDHARAIEVVYAGSDSAVCIGCNALDEADIISTLGKVEPSAPSTQRTSFESTSRSSNMNTDDSSAGELGEEPRFSNLSEGANSHHGADDSHDVTQQSSGEINASKSGESRDESKDEYEEPTPKEVSRRLVEYFVVVSSVPKVRKPPQSDGKPKRQTSSCQSPQNHCDAKRVPIEPEGRSSSSAKVAQLQSNAPPSPIQVMNDAIGAAMNDIGAALGEPLPGEKKSIANLQETDKLLEESMFGESYGAKQKGTEKSAAESAAEMAPSIKSSFLKSVAGQKKKVRAQANTAKAKNEGLQNLEKKLESLNLDKTLAKFKSMNLLGEPPKPQRRTPVASSAKGERGNNPRRENRQEMDDNQSSSSDSSVSLDGDTRNERSASLDSVEGSAVRPSQNLTSSVRVTPPPPPSFDSPPRPQQRPDRGTPKGASGNPRIAPLPDRNSTARGASENIRIGHEQSFGSRDHNDDIDDCVLEPVITAQYPAVDHADQPLNPMLPQFCHPQGTDVIVPLHEYKMPTVHHFVLTDAAGGKLYGTCLTVYEEFTPPSDLEITSGEHQDDDVDHSHEEGHERGYVEISATGTPKAGRTRRRSRNHKYYAPRVLCLLSTWPYLSAFRTYLTQLYRLATTTNLMTAPLERYILNICSEVPAPPPGSFEVKLDILGTNIRFWAPPADQPIPYVSLPYGVLFECLDIGNVLFAWYTLACERKMLLVSSQLSLLSVCAEILCSMIFPMRWSHLYIPCLPRFLTPMLDAPMPYLCGISRDVYPYAVGEISDETVVVDLDRNVITMGRNTPDLPLLPHKRKLKLEAALEKHAGDVFWKARGLTTSQIEETRLSGDENRLAKMLGTADAVWDEKICVMDEAFNLSPSPDSMSLLYSGDGTGSNVDGKQSRWDAVQEAFLRFYVSMLKDYQRFMPSMPSDKRSSWRGPGASIDGGRFRSKEFVHSQLPDFQPFLDELLGTQQFDDFVTRRMYNAGDAPDIRFFDSSIDAKRNRSKLKVVKKETPFLHSANAHRHLKQVDAIQPNQADMPPRSRFDNRYDFKNGKYSYPTFPESFDESLFGTPRPIPQIITAEFDRRSALASMLRARRGVAVEGRIPGSNNPSPEATAFVLFFVTFTEIIGKEWTELEQRHEMRGANLLDHCSMDSSQVSEGPWQPKVNPPWMEGQSFHGLHSTFKPEKKPDPPVEVVQDVGIVQDESNGFCAPDCSNLCGDVGKAIDPSSFLGWGRDGSVPVESEVPNGEFVKSPSEEELENEITKARAVAKSQIDLGFNTLKMMRLRKLPTEAIPYKTLIEACGRCGIAHRAQTMMEMMTQDGMALDSEVYFAFIKAFSNAESGTIPTHSMTSTTDTASEFSASKSALSVTSSSASFLNSSQGENDQPKKPHTKSHGNKIMDGLHNAVSSTIESNRRAFKNAKSRRMKRLAKQKLTKRDNLRVTRAIKTHLELSHCLLEDLYPGLKIDAGNATCPKCSRNLTHDEVILGWKPCQVEDYSTACPSCKHRFVPKFTVSCTSDSFEGSQGMGTTLYCFYLSPWVLLQEIRSLITPSVGGKAAEVLGVKSDETVLVGIDGIIDPKFREGTGINATLWWNVIVTFTRFQIPFTFLLQGSYPDQQLIAPTPEDEIIEDEPQA